MDNQTRTEHFPSGFWGAWADSACLGVSFPSEQEARAEIEKAIGMRDKPKKRRAKRPA